MVDTGRETMPKQNTSRTVFCQTTVVPMHALCRCLPAAGLVAAVLTLVAASSFPARAQSFKVFDDWMLGCDNRRQCVAVGLEEPKEDVNGLYLRVLRSGEGNAEPAVKITAYAPERAPALGTAYAPELGPARVRLAFDDPALPVPPELAASQAQGRESIEVALPRETVRSFVATLRLAKTLFVSIVHGTQPARPLVISLSGATAALTAMDEQQMRVGTTTALISLGTEPAMRVPPPPVLPVIRAAKRNKAKPPATMPKPVAAAVEKADCDEPPEIRPIRAWLDQRTLLWGVLCTRGAYRDTYAFFVHRLGARTADPMNFQLPGFSDLRSEDGDNQLTNPSFDQKTMMLTFHDRGRSMGDCGMAGQFVWDGTTFQPIELRGMPDCRGVWYEDWPVTWRAAVR
jgi:hypothetical protein